MWLGDDGYEGYLEICTYTNPGLHYAFNLIMRTIS